MAGGEGRARNAYPSAAPAADSGLTTVRNWREHPPPELFRSIVTISLRGRFYYDLCFAGEESEATGSSQGKEAEKHVSGEEDTKASWVHFPLLSCVTQDIIGTLGPPCPGLIYSVAPHQASDW